MRARFFLTKKKQQKQKEHLPLIHSSMCQCIVQEELQYRSLASFMFLLITLLSLGKIRRPSVCPDMKSKRTCQFEWTVSGIDASV